MLPRRVVAAAKLTTAMLLRKSLPTCSASSMALLSWCSFASTSPITKWANDRVGAAALVGECQHEGGLTVDSLPAVVQRECGTPPIPNHLQRVARSLGLCRGLEEQRARAREIAVKEGHIGQHLDRSAMADNCVCSRFRRGQITALPGADGGRRHNICQQWRCRRGVRCGGNLAIRNLPTARARTPRSAAPWTTSAPIRNRVRQATHAWHGTRRHAA